MTTELETNKIVGKPENRLPKRMALGAALAMALLSIAFLTLGESNTEDRRWMILPYIFVPAAGALGGIIFHLTQPMRNRGGTSKLLAKILSGLAYVILLAIAFVLGMNGPD